MCGRFSLGLGADAEALFAALRVLRPEPVGTSFNVAPSHRVPVILPGNEDTQELTTMHWGLVPAWSKSLRDAHKPINARIETVSEKPSFREAFRHRRCLVPADSFYEWQAMGKKKIPFRILRKDEQPMLFAGIWETWQDPGNENATLQTVCILTTDASPEIARLHHRMPVILSPQDGLVWMRGAQDEALSVAQDHAHHSLRAYEVDRAVNSPANDVPELHLAADHTNQESGTEKSQLSLF